MSALHKAAEKLDVDEIKRLVADGADLTALNEVRFSLSGFLNIFLDSNLIFDLLLEWPHPSSPGCWYGRSFSGSVGGAGGRRQDPSHNAGQGKYVAQILVVVDGEVEK